MSWRDVSDLLTQLVTITPCVSFSTDGHETPVYSTCAPAYPARVSAMPGGAKIIRTPDGRDVVATYTVVIGTTELISFRDKLTLPSGYDPQGPVVAAVKSAIDETGAQHHVRVDVGAA